MVLGSSREQTAHVTTDPYFDYESLSKRILGRLSLSVISIWIYEDGEDGSTGRQRVYHRNSAPVGGANGRSGELAGKAYVVHRVAKLTWCTEHLLWMRNKEMA